MPHLTLGVLGSLRVLSGDAPVAHFESDKVRALLVYLAVEADSPHRREALLGLLWPDCPEEIARRNLRQALYNLRKSIGDSEADPPYLLISRDEIQFNPASDHSLDAAAFHALLDTCDDHLPRCIEACPIHAGRLEEGLSLYRGPFLDEFFLEDSTEFEEWAVRQRERHHRRAIEALTYLANYAEQGGQYEAAERWALRLLELDPWQEEAHRQVMRSLSARGRRGEALAAYENCRRVLVKELGVEPSIETVELYEQIKRGQPAVGKLDESSISGRTSPRLPIQVTPFIGREKELEELASLLADPQCRLLTLTGPGGIGKTRLALQAATNAKDKFAHGAAFVGLAAIDSPDLIAPAVAQSIGLVLSGPLDPKMQLVNYLRGKEMLLLLDNAEHLLDAATLFHQVLEQAPRVKLLVTSREQLNLSEEWLFEVEGLGLPRDEGPESFEESSAVSLFMQRARRAQMGFTLREDEREAVVRITRLVGGTPLAIELAAAWVRTLPPRDIAREIERGLGFLAANVRDLPERHQSLRAVFDHSWQLLTADEQAVLARLSIFRGGFRLEAAEAVADANLALLSALLAKSLLRRMTDTPSTGALAARYELHELVRQYAAERLRLNPEEEKKTRDRHSDYYVNFASDMEKHLKGPAQLEALAEMTAEMENIRIGWRPAVACCRVEAVRKPIRAFWSLFEMRGWFQEGQALFAWAAEELQSSCHPEVASQTGYQILLAQLQSKQGWFSVRLGRREEARRLLEPSVAALRSLGSTIELVHALHHLGVLEWQAGNSVGARACFLEELDLATQIEDPWEIALANGNYGIAAQTLGEMSEALGRFQSGLAAYRSLGDERMTGVALYYLGQLQYELGMDAAARDALRESIARSRRLGEPWLLGMALTSLGDVVARADANAGEAVELYRESLALFEQVGERWSMVETLCRLGAGYLALGREVEARATFENAYDLAAEAQLMPGILRALVGIAECAMTRGEQQSALVILTGVLDEPSIVRSLWERGEQLRAELVAGMSPEEITIAEEAARARAFGEIEPVWKEPGPLTG